MSRRDGRLASDAQPRLNGIFGGLGLQLEDRVPDANTVALGHPVALAGC